MSARSLLARLTRLETSNTSPLLRRIGSLERFEHGIADDIAAGTMCPVDGPFIAACVRKWVTGTHHVQNGNVVDSFTPPRES